MRRDREERMEDWEEEVREKGVVAVREREVGGRNPNLMVLSLETLQTM